MSEAVGILDGLVARVLATYPYRFTLATDDATRARAYRIRAEVAVASGWVVEFADGLEHDEFDAEAVHVLGWDGDEAVSTGRLVLPGPSRPVSPLPTERACGIVVQPAGQVVDVGRMAVTRSRQSVEHAAFVALLCRLYLEMRTRGFAVACGMMSRRTRRAVSLLGLHLEQLGADRDYWGEPRAPVRFELLGNSASLSRRW
jgi:N-acyl-L-homoserine lactone synthetase